MNAARRLHTTLSAWSEAHGSNLNSVAGSRQLDDEDAFAAQLEAFDDLRLIEEGLNELEEQGARVGVYRKYLSSWRRMTLGYPNGWGGNIRRGDVYDAGSLDHLDTLADRFDERLPALSPLQKTELGDLIASARAALDADETLSKSLRLYLGRLLNEIRNALDDEHLDERFDYAAAAHRLWVTLLAAAEQSTDEGHKATWRDTARRFVWDATVAMVGNGPSIGLALTGLGG